MSSILSIGKSALAAASAGLNTTGHNIANAATPGYSRQVVQQRAATAQDFGFGYIGQGAQIDTVRRIYSDFLGGQVNTAQSAKSNLESYHTQISQVDNLLADPLAGLSPSLQEFFNGVQDLSASPNSAAARQATLSTAQTMAARFQSLDNQLQENRDGINSQITTSVATINSFAERIAALNESIAKAVGTAGGQPPNDLLDQRDFLVSELSKETKATVVKQDGATYNVFIGNGQALVVGGTRYSMQAVASPTDLSRVSVAYEKQGVVTPLADTALAGGKLGGLLDFRANTLDVAQNALGRTAIAMAATFNAQHRLGQDQNGALGGNFFSFAAPSATPNANNTSAATVDVAITNAGALTTSNYSLSYDGTQYQIKRLSDGVTADLGDPPADFDGFSITPGTVPPAAGDRFLVKPTATGASSLQVAISDISRIAAAAPIRTTASVPTAPITTDTSSALGTISDGTVDAGYYSAPLASPAVLQYDAASNSFSGFPSGSSVVVTSGTTSTTYASGTPVPYTAGATYEFSGVNIVLDGAPADADQFTVSPSGTGKISPGSVDAVYLASPLTSPVTMTYDLAADTLTGFPSGSAVEVTSNGVTTTYAAGTPVDFVADATYRFDGISFTLSGKPANGDTFRIEPNSNAAGDNRNALLLGALQTTKTMAGGTTTYQGSYSQLVSQIGNKTREVGVSLEAEGQQLASAVGRQQSESGVNLDEEAANLLRYQQAYQAAGKVMQTASKLFDVLLSLGT